MSIKALAQKVVDLYAQGYSAGDDNLFNALVELGDAAKDIVELVELCEEYVIRQTQPMPEVKDSDWGEFQEAVESQR